MRSFKPKKIVYLVHCYPPAVGGLEYLSGEIVKILREAGHDVHVITGRGRTLDSYKSFSDWVDNSCDPDYVHRLPLRFFWQRLSNKFLNKIIFISGSFSPWYFGPILKYSQSTIAHIKNADVIIGAGMPTMMFYQAYRFARKYQKKLILHPSYHDVSYYNRSFFFQKALDFAEKIIYQTPLEKEVLLKNYSVNSAKLIQATYSPYSASDWKIAQKRAEHKLKTIQEKIALNKPIVLGYVGQITPRKNLKFFNKIIQESLVLVNNKKINTKVLLAGAKTNDSLLVEQQLTQIKDKLQIIYDFPQKDKERIYNQIDIFVNPSEEESLGLVNFEAMYYGIPSYVHNKSAFSSLYCTRNTQPRVSAIVFKEGTLKKIDKIKFGKDCSYNIYKSQLVDLIINH